MVWFAFKFSLIPLCRRPLPPSKTVWRLFERNPFVIHNPKCQNVISTRLFHSSKLPTTNTHLRNALRTTMDAPNSIFKTKQEVSALCTHDDTIENKSELDKQCVYTVHHTKASPCGDSPQYKMQIFQLCCENGLQWFSMTPHMCTYTQIHREQKIITNNGLNA